MGTFRVGCLVENHVDRSRSARILRVLVDTGSEYSWLPTTTLERIGVKREKKNLKFVMANGELITRSVGFAILRVAGQFTINEVVFAEPGDLLLLGAQALEGLNLSVDSAQKEAGGRRPAAGGVRRTSRSSGIKERLNREGLMQYVVNDDGNKQAVILPIAEYEELLENLHDLVAAAERRNEATASHEQLKAELKKDGILPD